MARRLSEIEREAMQLSAKERAELARELIASLDEAIDADVEELWLAEAERRYEAYQRGEVQALPADEVIAEIRNIEQVGNAAMAVPAGVAIDVKLHQNCRNSSPKAPSSAMRRL